MPRAKTPENPQPEVTQDSFGKPVEPPQRNCIGQFGMIALVASVSWVALRSHEICLGPPDHVQIRPWYLKAHVALSTTKTYPNNLQELQVISLWKQCFASEIRLYLSVSHLHAITIDALAKSKNWDKPRYDFSRLISCMIEY